MTELRPMDRRLDVGDVDLMSGPGHFCLEMGVGCLELGGASGKPRFSRHRVRVFSAAVHRVFQQQCAFSIAMQFRSAEPRSILACSLLSPESLSPGVL